jgi:hypothetical protein
MVMSKLLAKTSLEWRRYQAHRAMPLGAVRLDLAGF